MATQANGFDWGNAVPVTSVNATSPGPAATATTTQPPSDFDWANAKGLTNSQAVSASATASSASGSPNPHPMADEFAKSFGLSGSDVSIGDAAKQFISGLGNAIKQSNREAANFVGEGRFGPEALALTGPNLIAHGVEGIANLLEQGTPMIVKGFKNGDYETAYRGMGKVLAAVTQMQMMREPNTTAPEYNPKNLQEAASGTGSNSLLNAMQGPINRSIGTAVRDVRYGDPSKALVDNGILSLTTAGRLEGVTAKLQQIKPQVDQALANSPKQIDVVKVLDPIVKRATQEINESFETPEAKFAAHNDVNALWMNALQKAPGGMADMVTANEIKQGIGDAVNWEKRPTPMMPFAEDAYRNAYGALKREINQAVPQVAPINENVTNLLAAKSALSETFLRESSGTAPGITLSFRQAAKEAGRVGPAAVRAVQAGKVAASQLRSDVGTAATEAASSRSQQ